MSDTMDLYTTLEAKDVVKLTNGLVVILDYYIGGGVWRCHRYTSKKGQFMISISDIKRKID